MVCCQSRADSGCCTMLLLWICLVCVLCGYVYTRVNHVRRLADKIPGERPWPLVGNALDVGTDPVEFLRWLTMLWRKYDGSIFGVWMGLDYFVILTQPEDVEVILSSSVHITKMKDYHFLEPWLGLGLLTSSGNQWRHSRKIITPTFHFKILEQYAEVFNRSSDVMVKKLHDQADGRVVDIYQYVTLCALDAVTESAMGIKINAQDDPNSVIVRSIYDICYVMMQRGFSAWKRFDALFRFSGHYQLQKKALDAIASFNEKVIMQRADVLRQNTNESRGEKTDEDGTETKKKPAFLDMLLTTAVDGQNLPDQMIRDEVATFMFEGHDTTTAALAFGLYSFANNPHIQQKAFEEQLAIFGVDKARHASYQDFQNMKYLDICIKEILRLYPSVPIIGRRAEEDIDINGHIIPAGTNMVIFIHAMNRNPKYHQNPDVFDPDRFLTDNRTNKHPYEYVSFSAGPRNCIGQKFAILELKSVYSKMLRNYELLPAGSEHDPIVYAEVTLKSKNGVSVKLGPRNYS